MRTLSCRKDVMKYQILHVDSNLESVPKLISIIYSEKEKLSL